jgi:biopolymer transport protein TolR
MGMTTAGSREINVTPLIDVLLVLLIIFLVMMPIMLKQETVELPPSNRDVISEAVPISIKLDADLSIKIDEGPAFVNAELAGRLRPLLHKDQPVFIDFADGVPWNEVIATVDTVRGVGGSLDGGVHVAVRLRDE